MKVDLVSAHADDAAAKDMRVELRVPLRGKGSP